MAGDADSLQIERVIGATKGFIDYMVDLSGLCVLA